MATVNPWMIEKLQRERAIREEDRRPRLYIDPPLPVEEERVDEEKPERGVCIIYERDGE